MIVKCLNFAYSSGGQRSAKFRTGQDVRASAQLGSVQVKQTYRSVHPLVTTVTVRELKQMTIAKVSFPHE